MSLSPSAPLALRNRAGGAAHVICAFEEIMNIPQKPSKPFWEQPESRRLEFKERFPKGDQIAKTVVAFANGAGGTIVFGVSNDPRQMIGFPDDELFRLEERISNHIFDQCAPTIIPGVYIQAVEGKNLLVVEIFPGSHKPYYLKAKGKHKGTYVRIGSTDRQASEEMLEELERQRRKISFDANPVYDLPLQEVNLDRFKADYARMTGRTLDDDQLENLGLGRYERDHVYPTHAAVLLSDSAVRKRLFPYAKIECARFKGTDTRIFLDQMTIEGPIYAAVESCLAFVKKNTALSSRMGEVYREDRWEYPLEAIREAVSNAIIHRDYALLGSDIKVAIFDDMLEITSPGPLPETMPVEKLGTGRSEIRNRILAPIFKDMKLIEAWGTGIQKMRKALLNYPEIELVLQEVGHAFQVQLKKQDRIGTEQASNRDQIGTKLGLSKEQVGTKLGLSKEQLLVLENCKSAQSIVDLMGLFKRSNRTKFKKKVLDPLIHQGFLAMTEPDSPHSPKQKYTVTASGLEQLERVVK